VVEKAEYDVFYWQHVERDNPEDERVIATVVGLRNCQNAAMAHATLVGERWNERTYICALRKDGGYAEKHRYLR
jgi:hypothetical protein